MDKKKLKHFKSTTKLTTLGDPEVTIQLTSIITKQMHQLNPIIPIRTFTCMCNSPECNQ